jgi:hypothetical protein
VATSTDPPPTTPESDSFSPLPSDIRKQRKQQRKQHDKHILLLLDQQESAFIECNIVQAENECTALAKEDRSNPQRLAIDAEHQLTTNKQPSFRQRFVNGNTMGSCFKQAVQRLQATKHVSFAPKHTVHIFDTLQPAVMITYDSGAGGHYLSKIDRQQAQLPILRPSTKQVRVANGGSSSGKHVTQLPFEQLSEQATKADSFEDFPHSLMSVGKTADNGTISIFTNDGVTVHKEQDVLITCKGEPILVVSGMNMYAIASPSINKKVIGNHTWQRNVSPRSSANSTTCTIYPQPSKPLNGCTRFVGTLLNLQG